MISYDRDTGGVHITPPYTLGGFLLPTTPFPGSHTSPILSDSSPPFCAQLYLKNAPTPKPQKHVLLTLYIWYSNIYIRFTIPNNINVVYYILGFRGHKCKIIIICIYVFI